MTNKNEEALEALGFIEKEIEIAIQHTDHKEMHEWPDLRSSINLLRKKIEALQAKEVDVNTYGYIESGQEIREAIKQPKIVDVEGLKKELAEQTRLDLTACGHEELFEIHELIKNNLIDYLVKTGVINAK